MSNHNSLPFAADLSMNSLADEAEPEPEKSETEIMRPATAKDITEFIAEQTMSQRANAPIRIANLCDADGRQFRVSNYTDCLRPLNSAENIIASISVSGSDDSEHCGDATVDGDTDDQPSDFVVIKKEDIYTLNAVTYDQDGSSRNRICADSEAGLLLEKLEAALDFQRHQFVAARLSRGARRLLQSQSAKSDIV